MSPALESSNQAGCLLLMMDLYKQTRQSAEGWAACPAGCLGGSFQSCFSWSGNTAVGCWLVDPLQTDRPGAAEEGAEDKAGERSPGASVGRTLPSATKIGGSRHLRLLLQFKPLCPATPSTSSSSEAPPRPRRGGP